MRSISQFGGGLSNGGGGGGMQISGTQSLNRNLASRSTGAIIVPTNASSTLSSNDSSQHFHNFNQNTSSSTHHLSYLSNQQQPSLQNYAKSATLQSNGNIEAKLRGLNEQQTGPNSVSSLNQYTSQASASFAEPENTPQQYQHAQPHIQNIRDNDSSTHGSRTIDSRYSRDKTLGLSDEESDEENEEEDENENEETTTAQIAEPEEHRCTCGQQHDYEQQPKESNYGTARGILNNRGSIGSQQQQQQQQSQPDGSSLKSAIKPNEMSNYDTPNSLSSFKNNSSSKAGANGGSNLITLPIQLSQRPKRMDSSAPTTDNESSNAAANSNSNSQVVSTNPNKIYSRKEVITTYKEETKNTHLEEYHHTTTFYNDPSSTTTTTTGPTSSSSLLQKTTPKMSSASASSPPPPPPPSTQTSMVGTGSPSLPPAPILPLKITSTTTLTTTTLNTTLVNVLDQVDNNHQAEGTSNNEAKDDVDNDDEGKMNKNLFNHNSSSSVINSISKLSSSSSSSINSSICNFYNNLVTKNNNCELVSTNKPKIKNDYQTPKTRGETNHQAEVKTRQDSLASKCPKANAKQQHHHCHHDKKKEANQNFDKIDLKSAELKLILRSKAPKISSGDETKKKKKSLAKAKQASTISDDDLNNSYYDNVKVDDKKQKKSILSAAAQAEQSFSFSLSSSISTSSISFLNSLISTSSSSSASDLSFLGSSSSLSNSTKCSSASSISLSSALSASNLNENLNAKLQNKLNKKKKKSNKRDKIKNQNQFVLDLKSSKVSSLTKPTSKSATRAKIKSKSPIRNEERLIGSTKFSTKLGDPKQDGHKNHKSDAKCLNLIKISSIELNKKDKTIEKKVFKIKDMDTCNFRAKTYSKNEQALSETAKSKHSSRIAKAKKVSSISKIPPIVKQEQSFEAGVDANERKFKSLPRMTKFVEFADVKRLTPTTNSFSFQDDSASQHDDNMLPLSFTSTSYNDVRKIINKFDLNLTTRTITSGSTPLCKKTSNNNDKRKMIADKLVKTIIDDRGKIENERVVSFAEEDTKLEYFKEEERLTSSSSTTSISEVINDLSFMEDPNKLLEQANDKCDTNFEDKADECLDSFDAGDENENENADTGFTSKILRLSNDTTPVDTPVMDLDHVKPYSLMKSCDLLVQTPTSALNENSIKFIDNESSDMNEDSAAKMLIDEKNSDTKMVNILDRPLTLKLIPKAELDNDEGSVKSENTNETTTTIDETGKLDDTNNQASNIWRRRKRRKKTIKRNFLNV